MPDTATSTSNSALYNLLMEGEVMERRYSICFGNATYQCMAQSGALPNGWPAVIVSVSDPSKPSEKLGWLGWVSFFPSKSNLARHVENGQFDASFFEAACREFEAGNWIQKILENPSRPASFSWLL